MKNRDSATNSRPIGIAVFGHGSSVESANEAVRTVAREAARQGGWTLYETAFLEAAPRLNEAVEKLAAAGAAEILVLPYFLTLGIHLQRDLPLLVADLEHKFGIPVRVAPPLDGHPGLSAMLADRAKALLP
jgi:sirohydrochlorin ferrochelatase